MYYNSIPAYSLHSDIYPYCSSYNITHNFQVHQNGLRLPHILNLLPIIYFGIFNSYSFNFNPYQQEKG